MIACMWVVLVGGTAWAAESSGCDEEGLKSADVSVRLEIRTHGFDEWLAASTTTVEVPQGWELASRLLWEDDEDDYLNAMRCLLGPTDADEKHRHPTVVKRGERLIVTDTVRISATEPYPREKLGFWDLELGIRDWSFSLVAPKALKKAQWSWVTIASGTPVKWANSAPSYRDAAGTLTWSRWAEPDPNTLRQVSISLAPPGPMALAWWLNQKWYWLVPLGLYGVADLLVYVPALVIAVRLRRHSDVGRTATWLLSIITVLAAAHGLVLLGSGLAELVWWPNFSFLGDILPVGESVAWASLLVITALMIWSPRPKSGALATGVVVVIGALAGVVWLAMMARPDKPWNPTITRPLSVDNLPIALGAVGGLAVVAAYAGVVDQVMTATPWKALRWKTLRTTYAVGLPLLIAGIVLALVSPVQYAAYRLSRGDTIHWLADGQGFLSDPNALWRDALAYPRWMIDLVTVPLWMLVALIVLVLLYQRRSRSIDHAEDRISNEDRCLAVFLFVLVAVWWPHWYAGLWFPLAALVTFGSLLACLYLWPPRTLLLRRGRQTFSGDTHAENVNRPLIEQAQDYSELQARGTWLEAQWSSGDVKLGDTETLRQAYNTQRKMLQDEITKSRHAAGLASDEQVLTPIDVYLAQGPDSTPWGNGVLAAERALIPALLATAYMLAIAWRHGAWHTTLDGWFGPAQLILLNTTGEFVSWVGIAFVLGFLWRELPGTRGYAKPWPLIAAYSLGVGAHYLLSYFLGQKQPQGQLTRIMLMIVFLAVVAVLVDMQALHRLREAWSSRLGPLITVYGLRSASATIAFLLAQAVALFTLWQQLRTGAGVTQGPGGPGPSR
jgi:hypothetical protein